MPLGTILALFLACSGEPPAPEVTGPEPAVVAAAASAVFCTAAEQISQPCLAEGGTVKMGDREIMITPTITSFMTLDPRQIGMGASAEQVPGEAQLGLSLEVAVDGHSLGAVTVHDTGNDVDLLAARTAAVDAALQRWMVAYGLAVLDAVVGGEKSAGLESVGLVLSPPETGGHRAYAAYPKLRGQGFDPSISAKLGPNVGSVMANLASYVEDLDDDALHSVHMLAKLGGGGAPGPCGILPQVSMAPGSSTSIVPLHGEVLVDGVAKGDICALSEPVAWPLPQGGALLEWEQYAVVKKLPPTEE